MSYSNLFVAKLPRNLNDAGLEQIFAEFNPISAKVMLDASSGKSKGFGFVLFRSEEEGKLAYQKLNRKSARVCRHNFTLVIYPSQHSGKAAAVASKELYIRNIPITMSQDRLKQFLSTFGKLTYCAMREDHHGNPVWVVYAEYDCIDCAKNALQKLHGNSEYFPGPPVMVKFADNEEAKQERRRRREEGKLAPAPVPRSACVFPPPRAAASAAVSRRSTTLAAIPNDLGSPVSHSVGSNTNSFGTPNDIKLLSNSTACSVGPNQGSDASSSASSAYRLMANAFMASSPEKDHEAHSPPLYLAPQNDTLPSMHPPSTSCRTSSLPAMQGLRAVGSTSEVASGGGVLVLENGQQLVLASNAVNVRPTSFGSGVKGTVLWSTPGTAKYTQSFQRSTSFIGL